MTSNHAKAATLLKAWRLYLERPEGLSDAELAAHLRVSVATANRYRRQLGGGKITAFGKYTMEPTNEDISLAEAILARK